MAGKMKIPKSAQIKGLKKALRNRKTPRAFIPSLKKRLKALGGALVISLLSWIFTPTQSLAQTPVTVSPSQQVLAPAGTACTGTTQTFNVNNRNQTAHAAYIKTTSVTSLAMQIFGVDSAGNTYLLSDTATIGAPSTGNNPVLTANGYYPQVQVTLQCLPATTGTFILTYSGTSASSTPQFLGGAQLTQEDKSIAQSAAAVSDYAIQFQAPYGNSQGNLVFSVLTGTEASGSAVGIQCFTAAGTDSGFGYNFNLPTTGTAIFPVPNTPCPLAFVSYVHGGATAATYSLDYVFAQPGSAPYSLPIHIADTTADEIKSGSGIVHTVVIGTPAAGTVTFFDLAPAQCTGTPISNIKSVITATATFPSSALTYDAFFQNGICVKASATMDITINIQ